MVLNFGKKQYIHVEAIEALRFFEGKDGDDGFGVIFVDGQKMSVESCEFDVIEEAYVWQNGYSMYDKNLKKKGGK